MGDVMRRCTGSLQLEKGHMQVRDCVLKDRGQTLKTELQHHKARSIMLSSSKRTGQKATKDARQTEWGHI